MAEESVEEITLTKDGDLCVKVPSSVAEHIRNTGTYYDEWSDWIKSKTVDGKLPKAAVIGPDADTIWTKSSRGLMINLTENNEYCKFIYRGDITFVVPEDTPEFIINRLRGDK